MVPNIPWFLGGDFNEILNLAEKHDGQIRYPRKMSDLNMVLMECGLSDLVFEGYPFTWSKNREAPWTVRMNVRILFEVFGNALGIAPDLYTCF